MKFNMKCIILILFRATLDFKRIAGSRHCMHVYATGKQRGYSRENEGTPKISFTFCRNPFTEKRTIYNGKGKTIL